MNSPPKVLSASDAKATYGWGLVALLVASGGLFLGWQSIEGTIEGLQRCHACLLTADVARDWRCDFYPPALRGLLIAGTAVLGIALIYFARVYRRPESFAVAHFVPRQWEEWIGRLVFVPMFAFWWDSRRCKTCPLIWNEGLHHSCTLGMGVMFGAFAALLASSFLRHMLMESAQRP